MKRLVLAILSFFATWPILFGLFHLTAKHSISSTVPARFPFLVFTSGAGRPSVHVVYQEQLAAFLMRQPASTFLIPDGADDFYRGELARQSRHGRHDFDTRSADPWVAIFEVKRLDGARQAVRLDATWDDDRINVGWYEATERAVRPIAYRHYFGPGLFMKAGMAALVLHAVFWGILVFVSFVRSRQPDRNA
jgi:hypothetical protein